MIHLAAQAVKNDAEIRSAAVELRCTLPTTELAKLYNSIQTVFAGEPSYAVQFTSAYNGEETHRIAFETTVFAATAMGKRTLFIEAAEHGNEATSAAKTLMNHLNDSLDEIIRTGKSPNDAMVIAEGKKLCFATLSSIPNTQLLESLFNHLLAMFDVIIIHAPATLSSLHSVALARSVNGTVLVVEAERTRTPVAMQVKNTIEASGGKIIGTVMSKRRFHIPGFIYNWLYR